jgi:hypothetical protein
MRALTQRFAGHVLRRPYSYRELPATRAMRVKAHPPVSGKAALYALMMSLWAAIIFGAMMAVSIV